MESDLRFFGAIKDDYEITEFTSVGQYLYKIAKDPSVMMFLESGASTGGSSRCIASGLKETNGHLYTFEASIERFLKLKENVNGLPVTGFNECSVITNDISFYYQQATAEFLPSQGNFESIISAINFDACFLDSINLCQANELSIVVKARIKNIIMHEPDHKCPGYDSFLLQNGYQLIRASRDEIDRFSGRNESSHCKPLWVHYLWTGFPQSGCL